MKLKFIGKNGSMGLIHGKVYNVDLFVNGKYFCVRWRTSIWKPAKVCPYGSVSKFAENWEHPKI